MLWLAAFSPTASKRNQQTLIEQPGFLHFAVILLLAAVLSVLLMRRLGLSPVLGYIVAGIAVGPWGLGLIREIDDVQRLAEFGVVLLLFLIGLGLNPQRLWALRRTILGTGTAQVGLTTAVIGGLALWLGLSWPAALVIGLSLSLSCTAIALQTLEEQHRLAAPVGITAFSVLLFQDIAALPMLALLPLLAAGTGEQAAVDYSWLGFFQIIGAIIAVIAVGHYLLRPLFRLVALANSRETFTAFSLLLVLGTALMMDSVGLSMAFGTFLAGVLLADSEYRHELELDIEPFKGLLLGLFFISVGMTIDFGLLLDRPLAVLGLVIGLVVIKLVLLLPLGWASGLSRSGRVLFAFVLSQAGEFTFVLLGTATVLGLLTGTVGDTLVLVAALSMASTPLLMLGYQRLVRLQRGTRDEPVADTVDETHPVVVAGFGRFGQILVRLLSAKGIRTTVLDHDPNQIELVRRFGYKAYYGDVTRLDRLRAAGLDKARLLVLAIDDMDAAHATARLVRQHFPQVRILARAHNRQDVYEFMKLDIEVVIRETFGSALEMAEETLRALGLDPVDIERSARQFRAHDLETLRALFPYHQDEGTLISKTKEARTDLARLLAETPGTPDKGSAAPEDPFSDRATSDQSAPNRQK